MQALGLTGLGALQNQLLQQGLTANDLATMIQAQAQANVNTANLGLGSSDLSSNVLGNSGLANSVLGANNAMTSGPLSGSYFFLLRTFPSLAIACIINTKQLYRGWVQCVRKITLISTTIVHIWAQAQNAHFVKCPLDAK